MLCVATVDIKGLDNCMIEGEKTIKIREYDGIIEDIKLRQFERTIQNNTEKISELKISFYPAEFEKRSENDIREIAKNVAKLVVKELINRGFDISDICIESPSICTVKNGKITASNQITIRSINDGSVKRRVEEETFVINSVGSDSKVIDALQEKNQIQKFENLYEILKKKCGNQVKVKEQIEADFAHKYDIKCDNENIDFEYVEKYSRARYQDDFTYLRTMISHGSSEYSEEIAKRLPRELRKIVKVINDLETED